MPENGSHKRKVLFATPSYDTTLSVDYTLAMTGTAILLTQMGYEMDVMTEVGNCFLGMVRNKIAQAFLASPADDLFFIDADVGWDPKVIPRILAHPAEIVAGLVPKRDIESDSTYHQNALTGVIKDKLFESLEAPTAFMRIKRSAFAKIEKPFFRAESSPDAYGEDIYFSRKWCAAGERFWIDPDINFTHRGPYAWRGNFYDHAVSSGLLVKGE
jgi:hypothetical protein